MTFSKAYHNNNKVLQYSNKLSLSLSWHYSGVRSGMGPLELINDLIRLTEMHRAVRANAIRATHFSAAVQEEMTQRAFLHGLVPPHLCEHVRLKHHAHIPPHPPPPSEPRWFFVMATPPPGSVSMCFAPTRTAAAKELVKHRVARSDKPASTMATPWAATRGLSTDRASRGAYGVGRVRTPDSGLQGQGTSLVTVQLHITKVTGERVVMTRRTCVRILVGNH